MDHLYIELGPRKQLNEIVMMGSHDAGIEQGAGNARTQALDIAAQARAGSRFFDIRVAAKEGIGNTAELRAFHGPEVAKGLLAPKSSKTRDLANTGRQGRVQVTNLRAGTWGTGLNKILSDARSFVSSGAYSSEFLILKFDKSSNWARIAETCVQVLGPTLYTDGGNLNTRRLGDLEGRVIVVFSEDGIREVSPYYTDLGILGWRNLYSDLGNYDANYRGLQYWGKGGTSVAKPFKKIKQNIKNQGKVLAASVTGAKVKKRFQRFRSVEYGPSASPNAMGMMYWTTTGVLENIQTRNNEMWAKSMGIDLLWADAFTAYADSALPQNMDFGSGGALKLFMPNIVMVDFADDAKGNYIYDLNSMAGTKLATLTERLYELTYGEQ